MPGQVVSEATQGYVLHDELYRFFALVLAAAFVLDDVLVVERAQDIDLPPPAGAELRAAVRLEGLHCHHLASAVVGRVVTV